MPSFKATAVFEFAQIGWSESIYANGDNLTAGSVSASWDRDFKATRLAALADTCYLRYLRVSNTDPPRDAVFTTYTYPSGQGRFASGSVGPESVQTAANLRVFAGPTTWRSYLIRGLPQVAVKVETSQQGLRQEWIDQALAFQVALASGRWSLRKPTYTGEQQLNTISTVSDKLRTITVTVAIPGIIAGDTIRIRQAAGVSNLNGLWKVTFVSPTGLVYTVKPKRQLQLGTFISTSGLVSRVVPTYPIITITEFVGVTTRRVGRPLYQPRGRRSARSS